MKTKIFSVIAVLATLSLTLPLHAQSTIERNDIMYNSYIIANKNQLNPAFFHQVKNVYVSFPSNSIGFSLPLSYSDIPFRSENGKSYILANDLQELFNNPNSRIRANVHVGILGFGFRAGNSFCTFDASVQAYVQTSAPYVASQALNLFKNGIPTSPDENSLIKTGNLVDAQAYTRLSIGGGYETNFGLTVGGHVNILDGLQNVSTSGEGIRLYSPNTNYSTLNLIGDISVQHAGMIRPVIDEEGHINNVEFNKYGYAFGGNLGFSFDLGAVYRLEGLEVSAALVDIGPGIHWKMQSSTIELVQKEIHYSGINLDNLVTTDNAGNSSFNIDLSNSLLDTLQTRLNYHDTLNEGYWGKVPAKLYLGANYRIFKFLSVGALFHGEWDRGLGGKDNTFRYNLNLSLSLNVSDRFELLAASGLCFDGNSSNFFNPGLGMAFSIGGVVQMYAMMDYVSSFYLVNQKALTFNGGISLLFGKRHAQSNTSAGNDAYNPGIVVLPSE